MPIASTSVERRNFTAGLVTEATALTFPENAALAIDNYELNRDGSIFRRLGMDIENQGTPITVGRNASNFDGVAISSYKWDSVNNDPNLSIGVVQVGNSLWFTDLQTSTLSANLFNSGDPLELSEGNIGTTISGNTTLFYTAINGLLIITSEELPSPYYLQYIKETDTVDITKLDIKVRDLWGVFDGLNTNTRPATITDKHSYNLQNQGWPANRIQQALTPEANTATTEALKDRYPEYYNTDGTTKYSIAGTGEGSAIKNQAILIYAEFGINGNVITTGATTKGYPSNADIPWVGKTDAGGFDTALIDGAFRGTTPAPRGKFIIDAFNRGESRTDITAIDLPIDKDLGSISVAAAYANRLFYSGVDSNGQGIDTFSPNYTGTIFFTQNIDNIQQFSKCYQQADPTSEDDPVLVATDGGVIKIAEASRIIKMVAVRTSLIVFAENGVWAISGADGIFRADDFSITQVTNVGTTSPETIVVAEDTVFYWAEGGIYAITQQEINATLQSQNITERTIQTLYNSIPTNVRQFTKGMFDSVAKKVTWLYSDADDYDGITLRHKYNRELVLDLVLSAFYTRTIADSSEGKFVAAYVQTDTFINADNVQQVVHNGEPVVVNNEEVVVTEQVRTAGDSFIKYLTFEPDYVDPTVANPFLDHYGMSFSLYKNNDFKDWNETDASANLVTGYEFGGDTQRGKQVTYLTAHFNRTETGFEEDGDGFQAVSPSGCQIRARWDFADSAASGKWSTQFQGYRLNRNYLPSSVLDDFDYGYSVISTKTKLRGSGRSVAIELNTEPGKDCQMLGWGMVLTGKASV